MRVVYLIAGAGGMYCGSCLRDNRLAATLIKQGRDVVLVPLYTPIRTDEADVSEGLISITSPVGQALMGKEVDDTVAVKVPKGSREFDVLEILIET